MSREKVFDDPLMAMLGGSPSSSAPSTTSAFAEKKAAVGLDAGETIRTLDTSKVNLKKQGNKSVAAASTTSSMPQQADPLTSKLEFSPQENSADTAVPGVGVEVNWENKLPKSNIFDELTSSNSSSDCGIFSSSGMEEKSKSSVIRKEGQAGSGKGRFKVAAEENDGEFQDLDVGKLVEEEDLTKDYNVFGKNNLRTGTRDFVQAQAAISKVKREDLELESNEYISQLESVTKSSKKQTEVPKTVFSSDLFGGANNSSNDVNVASLDINDLNAYISQNSQNEGGLFD